MVRVAQQERAAGPAMIERTEDLDLPKVDGSNVFQAGFVDGMREIILYDILTHSNVVRFDKIMRVGGELVQWMVAFPLKQKGWESELDLRRKDAADYFLAKEAHAE